MGRKWRIRRKKAQKYAKAQNHENGFVGYRADARRSCGAGRSLAGRGAAN
jgi:hypothetical protein